MEWNDGTRCKKDQKDERKKKDKINGMWKQSSSASASSSGVTSLIMEGNMFVLFECFNWETHNPPQCLSFLAFF